MTDSPLSDTTPTRFCITCAEPGCSNHIHYRKGDLSVPLYCEEHRTTTGRHSYVRVLIEPQKKIDGVK